VPWAPKANPGLKDVQVLVTAGKRDPICPLPLTETLVRFFKVQGSKVDLVLHDGGHDVRQEELAAIGAFLRA
jgi:phospholipase/carboxylesterase